MGLWGVKCTAHHTGSPTYWAIGGGVTIVTTQFCRCEENKPGMDSDKKFFKNLLDKYWVITWGFIQQFNNPPQEVNPTKKKGRIKWVGLCVKGMHHKECNRTLAGFD